MSKTKALHMLHTFWYIFVTTAGNYVQTSVSKHEKKICQHLTKPEQEPLSSGLL